MGIATFPGMLRSIAKDFLRKLKTFRRSVLIAFWSWLLLYTIPKFCQAQPLPFDHITINEGLSNNTVYCTVQDKDGFLWFGTRDGLNRYDGYEFRVYKSDLADSSSLPSNNIQALYVHRNGDLWIGLRRGGIYIFKRNLQRFVPLEVRIDPVQDIRAVAIQRFFRDSRGDIWVGTAGLGILRISEDGNVKDQFAAFLDNPRRKLLYDHCFSFAEDHEGNVWFGTDGDAVHCYKPDADAVEIVQKTGKAGLYSYRKSLLVLGDSLFIGTEGNGIFLYSLSRTEFLSHRLPGRLVRDMNKVDDERIFISTDGEGLYSLDMKQDTLLNYRFSSSLKNSLNTNAIYDIYEDIDGNIWIGTFNGGVNLLKARGARFISYLPSTQGPESPGAFSVLSFFEEADGRVLVGLDGGGIWEFTPSLLNNVMTPFQSSVPDDVTGMVITSIFRDSQGYLWVGTFAHGLTRIDPDGTGYYTYTYDPESDEGITNDNIWDLTEDEDGMIWIAALGGGVLRYEGSTDKFTRYVPDPDDPGSLSDWNARVVFVDSRNRVWVGTEDGGLNLFLRNRNAFRSWKYDPSNSSGLQSNSVLCIFEDREGNIWVGTEGAGLHRYVETNDSFISFGSSDGFQSNVIHAIEQDALGLLWLSTNDGITSFNPANGAVNNFDSNDGLSSDQFNPDASVRTGSGEIIFGNIRGANGFIPEKVTTNPNPPGVVFTDFQLFNTSVEVRNSQGRKILERPLNDNPVISLLYRENVFTIAFAAIEFTNPSKNQFAYRLIGFEEDWNVVDAGIRKATYTNLDPGTYTFEVKASNNNGVWSGQVRRLQIEVAPPFYLTIWFRVLISAILLAVLTWFVRFRDARRKERHNKQLLVAEQKILQLKNRNLEEEVKRKHAELSAALLQSAHKNKALDGLKHQLAELSGRTGFENEKRNELKRLIRKIESEVGGVDYWERFQINFNQIHQQFAEKIHARHGNLTQNDIRLCCLIKINLTNREIAAIQNISLGGVEKSKFRLKRKLGLDPDQDLNAYILDFN